MKRISMVTALLMAMAAQASAPTTTTEPARKPLLPSAERNTERECARRRRQRAHAEDPLRRRKKIDRQLKRRSLLVGLEEARRIEKLRRRFAKDASFREFREEWKGRAAQARKIRRVIERHLQMVGGKP